MKVLVTGHRGFVGSTFFDYFRGHGHEVIGLDILHKSDCRPWLWYDETYFDLVIHCAAVVGGRAFIDGEPLQLAAEDLSIDAELFRWALRTRPGRIVYFSSAAVYPTYLQNGPDAVRLQEHHTDVCYGGHPDATYGMVKHVGERLALEANAIGVKTHVFRPFSGYGETQSLDYPFMSIVKRCLAVQPSELHGRVVDIWSNTVRDFVHIDDIVACVNAVIEADHIGPINICTGRFMSFGQLAKMAGATYVNVLDGMPTGVECRVGDPRWMEAFYTPKITLEEGIDRAQRYLLR